MEVRRLVKRKLKFSKKLFFFKQSFYFFKVLALEKFINIFLKGGKKSKFEKIILFYLKILKRVFFFFRNPVILFFKIMELTKFNVSLVSVRVGKKTHQLPTPTHYYTSYIKALHVMKRMLNLKKKSQTFISTLVAEHESILKGNFSKSGLIKKKISFNTTAFENRVYCHFRWY